MASHILTFIVAMNTIIEQGTCSIVFGIVGMIVSFGFSLPRTMRNMAGLSAACISYLKVFLFPIITAVFITMVAVGVQNPGTAIKAIARPNLVTGFTGVANIFFSYASHNTFFNMISELRDPRDFPKALAMLQCIDICLYLVAGVIIYRCASHGVTSSALGTAGPLMAKIAYGFTLPTIIVAGVIYGHVASKSIYLRIFAGTSRIHIRDWVAIGSWIGIGLSLWVDAWIIASSTPMFNSLLSLMSALFGSWFTYVLPAIFWFYMNKDKWFTSPRKIALAMLNMVCLYVGIIVVC
ncbi:hypothetical protein BBP40_002903 [Aspergillus hancockii]|nr:hypothetical protein BBP40_002903 [Aspergillus hancockii]